VRGRHPTTSGRGWCSSTAADAGLIGALLRAGLVDALSLVVAPFVAGSGGDRPLRLAAVLDSTVRLRLDAAEPRRDDHLHLRYTLQGG